MDLIGAQPRENVLLRAYGTGLEIDIVPPARWTPGVHYTLMDLRGALP